LGKQLRAHENLAIYGVFLIMSFWIDLRQCTVIRSLSTHLLEVRTYGDEKYF